MPRTNLPVTSIYLMLARTRQNPRSPIRAAVCILTSIAVGLTGMAIPAFSQQRRPIVISFGQPNVWSLEQAHYLLARMHRSNLDLQTTALKDLDPNAANASRIEILKTLLGISGKYDEAIGLNNKLLKDDKVFNSQRRQELLLTRSSLQKESTQLARDNARLKTAKAEAEDAAARDAIQSEIDANTEQKAAVDDQLKQTDSELEGLTSASGEFKSVQPEGSFNSADLAGDLDALIKKVELINPTIAATLQLENHIQMQYEIISKQLTLLRDEVGPGERLVFLELPQSISATQDKAENKMAQTWWRIASYTTVDRAALFEAELKGLVESIKKIEAELNTIQSDQAETLKLEETLTRHRHSLETQLHELCKKQEELEAAIEKTKALKKSKQTEELCNQLFQDVDQTKKAIAETREAIQAIDDRGIKLKRDRARLSQTFTALSTKYEKVKLEQLRRKIREQQDTADRLLQNGGANTSQIVRSTLKLMGREAGDQAPVDFKSTESNPRKSIPITMSRSVPVKLQNEDNDTESDKNKRETKAYAERGIYTNNTIVRTIDIIPRQNAVNVNDTKQRVSKTGIFAAFSFLFGFGGKFTYERQRENAEQFLNQELFTSGFGKGQTDFGWNFYPFAGTKQLASGIRTTYAVVIIPKEAESLVLQAQGCYFPRKDNQPLNYDQAVDGTWTIEGERDAACTSQQQEFVVPVPGASGDGSDFYITELRYSGGRKPGERIVASIIGQNLPGQIGILINGVPLTQSVGLAQVNVESILGDKVKENCVDHVCGRFERVDANQLVISFSMPPQFTGIPRISVVGPGKAIELNNLNLNVNGKDDTQLDASEYMFGKRPSEASRTIADFKVAPAIPPAPHTPPSTPQMTGVVSGGKFKITDVIYVNGQIAKASGVACVRPDLCIVTFPVQEMDYLTVTIAPTDSEEEAVSRTFVNPSNLTIISASIINVVPGDKDRPPVIAVKLDGSSFKERLEVDLDDTGVLQRRIVPSAGQMILEIASPKSVVQITLRDPDSNKAVSTVVSSPVAANKKDEN